MGWGKASSTNRWCWWCWWCSNRSLSYGCRLSRRWLLSQALFLSGHDEKGWWYFRVSRLTAPFSSGCLLFTCFPLLDHLMQYVVEDEGRAY